ncbi:hypothetical protein FOCC_FOCC016813 [Frankliniella occidentalis]|nr:hypothetical protein FOCC_FOCC016813 [Frankliniella occidentalis]
MTSSRSRFCGHTLKMTDKDKPKEPESDSFWKTVEKKMNCTLPKLLKNILENYGYDSLPAFRRFNASQIDNIEKFMQEKCFRLIEANELKDYYGRFAKAPELYELGGFRGVLEELADKFKNDVHQRPSTSSKGPPTTATQEPTSDTDLLLNEQNHLYEMLKTYINENFPQVFETEDADFGDDDQEQPQANELIVKVTKNGFGQFVATVQCPSCKKILNGSKTAKRWKHNVYRHIKDHHLKPIGKSNQKTLCESFNLTPKKSVTVRDCSRSPSPAKRRRRNSVNSIRISSEEDEHGESQEMHGETNKSPPKKSTENNGAPTNNSLNGDKEQTQSPTGSEKERNVETENNLEGSSNTLNDKEKANWSSFRQFKFLNNEGSLSAAAPSTCERQHIQLTESKWMKEWYSRSARIKRQLLDSGSLNVSKITDYFKIINEKDMLKLEVLMLKKRLSTFMSQPKDEPTQRLFISNFLQLLLTTAEANANRGLMLYEFLVLNLPIPSVTTVRDTLSSKSTLEEGAFRFKELDAFLTLHNLPRKVSVSEDGTRVQGRIQYHRKTNQIVGFPLRLDANGCPIVGSYPATSSTIIGKYFSENTASKNAYCIMVQPLAENAPSFCLALFGTNNKFSYKDIKNRWKWMRLEAKKYNIEIVNYSSDGDAKLLKAMMMNVFTEPNNSWFSADENTPVLHIQDHIHIGTKLKSRLLNPSVIIPMGNFIASRGHLVDLVKNCSKDQTLGLKESHLNPKDKMNYRSVELMTNPKLISFMLSKFPDAKATATYLNMSREVVYAFTQKDLSHSERIKMIWNYYCIELNAHAMVHMMRMFRDTEEPHLFLPWLTGSQPCEASFRSFRSMTSTHSTVSSQG